MRKEHSAKSTVQRIMWKYNSVFCLLISAFLLSACDVHQWPEENIKPEPEPEVETMFIPLDLFYNSDFYVWEHFYDPKTGRIVELYPDSMAHPDFPGTTSKYDNTQLSGVMDVYVKAYSGNKVVKEQNFSFDLTGSAYDTAFQIELPVDDDYTLAVWSHLRMNSQAEAFYNPSDFNKVSIIGENYSGNTDYRDGFSATVNVDTYSEKSEAYRVEMTRPMGKFEFLTLDLSEFLDRETTRRNMATRASADEYYVVVSFPYYFPSSYSLLDDRLENSAAGVSFGTRMTVTGDSEASLGFEYVMLNNITDGGIQTRVDIYDPSMEHVAGSTNLTIPMRRDNHTVLRGYFLSEQNDGGIGIDPDFEGDFNIPMY